MPDTYVQTWKRSL